MQVIKLSALDAALSVAQSTSMVGAKSRLVRLLKNQFPVFWETFGASLFYDENKESVIFPLEAGYCLAEFESKSYGDEGLRLHSRSLSVVYATSDVDLIQFLIQATESEMGGN